MMFGMFQCYLLCSSVFNVSIHFFVGGMTLRISFGYEINVFMPIFRYFNHLKVSYWNVMIFPSNAKLVINQLLNIFLVIVHK